MQEYQVIDMADPVQIVFLTSAITMAIVLGYMWKNFTVVPPTEAHVISGGYKPRIFDGQGRYILLPFWQKRYIVPRSNIEIPNLLIQLTDKNNLSFSIEIKCRVTSLDPLMVIKSFDPIDTENIISTTNIALASACRTNAKNAEFKSVINDRNSLEEAIYLSINDDLSKVGLRVVLLDILGINS